MIEYNKNNIPAARSLRKNMTPWEKKLWYQFLRNYPIRFQRQKAIGEYIVDFYCAKAHPQSAMLTAPSSEGAYGERRLV